MVNSIMADFCEILYATQVDANTYTYMWQQVDLAFGDIVAIEKRSQCSSEELYDAIDAHGFDTDRVFNHFENYPFSCIRLEDEY